MKNKTVHCFGTVPNFERPVKSPESVRFQHNVQLPATSLAVLHLSPIDNLRHYPVFQTL